MYQRLVLHQEVNVATVYIKDFGHVRGTLDFVLALVKGPADMGLAVEDISFTNF
jgi:hypothetical protein